MFDNVIMKAVTRRRRQSLLTSHLSSIYLFTCLELRSLEIFFKHILKFLERKGIGIFLQQFMGGGEGGWWSRALLKISTNSSIYISSITKKMVT